jgi:Ca2+-binding EF-hand superfamily protein
MKKNSGNVEQLTVPPTTRRLSNKQLKLGDEMFAALDQDGDGELDGEELARFGQFALPEIEVALRLGTRPGGAKQAEVMMSGKPPLKVLTMPRGADTVIFIEAPGVRLELIPPSAGANARSPRDLYLLEFRRFDRDANGYLDRNEADNSPLFRGLFSFFDTDGDGKIFEKELQAALAEVDAIASSAARGMVSIDLNEASRGLFGLIDANNDGRISIRELRAMPQLPERLGLKKDDSMALGDIPRRFEAPLSLGMTRELGPRLTPRFPNGLIRQSQPQPGPTWFHKMDRNRDGDVSRREFLGTEEDFRKLDLDGDGLISLQEAEAAGK